MSIRSMNARSSASISRALDEALVEAVGEAARVEAVLQPPGAGVIGGRHLAPSVGDRPSIAELPAPVVTVLGL